MSLINGKVYDWADITVKLPFGDVELQSIDYGDEQEKEVVYGKGNLPRGYGTGNYKATCKMSFLRDRFEQIEQYCKSQGISLYKLMISKVAIAYANEGDRTHLDEITKVGFTKIDHKAAQNDKSLTVDVECLVAGVITRDGLKSI